MTTAIGATGATTTTDFDTLREDLAGDLHLPGEPGWDEARMAWNLSADQHPVAVAFIEGADDAKRVVSFARDAGLRVNVQGTGHNATAIAGLDDTILVRTTRMRGVEIDVDAKTARVEAGALWMDVINPAAEHGLAALAGSALDVGVAGYVLGGGLSFLGRKHGLAANSVRSIELVTADGELVRTDASSEPDLFWALRGGGGNFGLVTAVELELYEISEVYAGLLAWPWEQADEAFRAWHRLLPDLDDETTTIAKLVQFPPFEEVPEPFRGRKLAVVEVFHLGTAEEGAEIIEPLRALAPEIDTMAMLPPNALPFVHMDPPEPIPGTSGHRQLVDVGEEIVDAAIEAAGAESGSPLIVFELRQLGGALRRSGTGQGAIHGFDADLAMFAAGLAAEPAMTAAARDQIGRIMDRFAFADAGSAYLNFAEEPTSSERFFRPATYRRLREVKTAYDAANVFRANHEIPPLGE